jgi:hypothetical protein
MARKRASDRRRPDCALRIERQRYSSRSPNLKMASWPIEGDQSVNWTLRSGMRWPMTRALLAAVIICLFPIVSVGQHRGGGGGGGHIGGAGPVAPASPGRPIGGHPTSPTYGFDSRSDGNPYWGAYRGFGTYGLGWGYQGSSFDAGWPNYSAPDEVGASAPSVVIMMPQIQPPEPPPPPAELVVHEYKWTNTNSIARTPFFIATKDGHVFRATAVWTQANVVSLITPNNTSKTIQLDQIDRDCTQRLNKENKLTLWLPPTHEQ